MRHPAPTPADSPFPLPTARSDHRRRQVGDLVLTSSAIGAFNDLLHELDPDAPHIDADAVATIARWLGGLDEARREYLLQARLGRLNELRAMRVDPGWSSDPAQTQRIDRLLAYIDCPDDLIPDNMPVYGLLDDALLVELAWPILADEVEDYRDFCRFRTEARRNARPALDQSTWLRARLEEGALWEHLHHVHEHPYVDGGDPERELRVR